MTPTFFWYDLETSGINPRESRIMQFAGQRTDMNLRLIGEPINVLIRLTEDVLPDPDAVLLTGITPQQTLREGITEAEFLKLFSHTIALPGTVFVGYNSIRFDDEFMRFLHYRNFYDPYTWQWQDSRSRWDLLNVVRMLRALRPAGITWPVGKEGKATNRLELLTAHNKLKHTAAHDALSDVQACIALARLIRRYQPKLFDYLLTMRDKKQVLALVGSGQPFVYTSGGYPGDYLHTSVASIIGEGVDGQGLLAYDLRYDPTVYRDMSPSQLAERWRFNRETPPAQRLPVKLLRANHSPAVAPVNVLDNDSQARLRLDMSTLQKHRAALDTLGNAFLRQLHEAQRMLTSAQQLSAFGDPTSVDGRLYEGFFDTNDQQLLAVVRAAAPEELGDLEVPFHDDRLQTLLPLYVARNFPTQLSGGQRESWETFRRARLLGGGPTSRLARYGLRLQTLSERAHLNSQQRYLIEELQLYGESIMPSD
ncbi:MAG TPA: exodeoxyribonuclease I [Candidatus Saccharimonadales bacterium]|nr:exodeoxyribonuclease I [Candidatus Saccharimonadales bacterium]